MQRKFITICLSLCVSVLVFICLVPLEKTFEIKNYHYQENKHAYPHAPNRALFYQSQADESLVKSYDLQGSHFLNHTSHPEPTDDECEEDPADRQRKKLLPNVIGLGAKKCGTTALHYYMKAHPKVKVPPDHEELSFFDRHWPNGIDWYLERLPLVADDEIVFEKTPKYFVYPPALDRIAATIPATKFILVLCNPIDRAYSDFNHKMRKSTKFQRFLAEEEIENFDDFVMRYSPKLRTMKEKKLQNLLEEGIYEEGKHWYSTFTVGFYAYHLKKFLDRFSRRQFLIISGEELRENPLRVMDKVQGFMDLPRCLTRDNFVFNETKGFYCIKDADGNEVCLDSNKGTSRKDSAEEKYMIETAEELANLYGPYNRQLIELGINMSWPFPT